MGEAAQKQKADQEAGRESPILSIRNLDMRFGAIAALDDVSMEILRGEVTGLVGDNGAGKSTLVKLISGVSQPMRGEIHFDGRPARFSSPAAAREGGIETVYQDLALAGNLPVWANVFLGRERLKGPRPLRILDRARMIRETGEMLARYRMNVPPIDSPIEGLSGGQRQIIAIARAAAWGSKLILMDEPTAALGVAETAAVEDVIRSLKENGFSVMIISHNLEQVLRLTDAVWVLRRGRMIGMRRTARTNGAELVSMITGAGAAS